MERSEPRVVLYWCVTGSLLALVVSSQVGLMSMMFPVMQETFLGVWWAVWLALAVALPMLLVALIGSSVRFRILAFRVDATQLRVRSGLFVHREKIVPTSRLQHVDVVSGPIERLFGLSSLIVFTAGGATATYRLPGLRPARAEELRALMLERAERTRAADGT